MNTVYKARCACSLLFYSSHFSFLVFGHFRQRIYETTKILRNLCLHFARQDGQDGKTKPDQNTKNQKTKIWDERNIAFAALC